MPEKLVSGRPRGHLPALLVREPRGDELLDLSRRVDRRDHAVARAGEGPGAVDDLAQDTVEVKGRADAKDRPVEGGDPLAQRRVLSPQILRAIHPSTSLARPAAGSEVAP